MSSVLPSSSNFTVLYVDDEAQSLKYFRKAFDKHFTVLTANSADEAKTLLLKHQHEIEILISDQRMPSITGVELLRFTHMKYPNMRLIITTAYADISVAADAINLAGVHKYVDKPWDIKELLAIITDQHLMAIAQKLKDAAYAKYILGPLTDELSSITKEREDK